MTEKYTYLEFLTIIIDDGIAAAKKDYRKKSDKQKLEGSIAGFESCRGKEPAQLSAILNEAQLDLEEARKKEATSYWYWNCRAGEIEWVCNVLSVALMNVDMPVIINPTARAVKKAAEILGVKES